MTKYRGCIDIHSGKVKQIVGGTLKLDDIIHDDNTTENFVSTKPSTYFANLYKESGITGCHVIKLGSNPANEEAAKLACKAWPHGLQIGGGINSDNAVEWLEKYMASHVIVTSWLFKDSDAGKKEFDWDRLSLLSKLVGKDRLIVDLSCRTIYEKDEKKWVVAINKWQTLTDVTLSKVFLDKVSFFCDEFLIHAADVEGLCQGIDEQLVSSLGKWCPRGFEGRIVYAGGAKLVDDLDLVKELSENKVDLSFGSALDIFGGSQVKFDELVNWNKLNSK
ncbi:uncharacterized protein PRCAT00000286001 [Priceomyces carsonii]|uniref:uncharacterized protein n=1 Tax=Priceomyces carsonii TaxID=28549 RepID=UPI002ED95B4A|nr:unnamed protein product [Priceomyces carsonii]